MRMPCLLSLSGTTSVVAALTAALVLSACATVPPTPTAAVPVAKPGVVTVTGDDLKLTGRTETGEALRQLVPSLH